MATFFHSKNQRLFIGGFDWSTITTDVQHQVTVDTADTTVIADSDRTFLAGHRDQQMNVSTITDLATLFPIEKSSIEGLLGSTSAAIISYCPRGESDGNPCRLLCGKPTVLNYASPITDAVKSEVSFVPGSSAGGAQLNPDASKDSQGSMIYRLTSTGSTQSSTSQSVSSTSGSTSGFAAHLHYFGTVGGGTVTIQVQHSSDDTTWVDLTSFSAVSAGFTAQREISTGAVKEFVRGTVSAVTSTSASLDFALTLARKG